MSHFPDGPFPRAVIFLAWLVMGFDKPAGAEDTAMTNPREAQPERPTVATHAYSVAPGFVELETGFQRQPAGSRSNTLLVPVLFKIGLGSRVQLDIAPGWQRTDTKGTAKSGMTDALAGLKWRLIDDSPVLGAFAIQSTISLPTGSAKNDTGTGSASYSVLAISSRDLGPVALDLNIGYTRSAGDGSKAPKNSTVWAVSTGFPVSGDLGWVAEIFGYPATSGPAGSGTVVGFLTGPTLTLQPALVLDAGAILNITGYGDTAIYAGLTWNMGRAWGPTTISR